ncbi:hypothetical protein GQ53DRAFT_635556 [Thozetella sp. PMI_491]|nr:hypothetical protein GQ53DRAFT_635556 [Thozetella sp. PMI_491]
MRWASKKQAVVALRALDPEVGVSLIPDDPEDMWHINNLIAVGDMVKAHAIRKVTTTTSTGSTSSERVHTDLTINVTSTFYDPEASTLHVSGAVVRENAFVNVGQYHTLDLEINRPFTIWKSYGWDSVAVEALKEALDDTKEDAIIAVMMQEGLANICRITEFRKHLVQRIDHTIPKKRSSDKEITAGTNSFYDKTLTAVLKAGTFTKEQPLILAGPGFTHKNFKNYIKAEGQRRNDKKLQELADNAILADATTGHLHGLEEVLRKPILQDKVRNRKFGLQAKLMDEFHEMLRKDDGRAWYGTKPVERAVNEGAVGGGAKLLVNDSLFRSADLATRRKYVDLVDRVKEAGGLVSRFSSDHESGQRLDALGGIAAILSYPLFDLDEEPEDDAETAEAAPGGEGAMII